MDLETTQSCTLQKLLPALENNLCAFHTLERVFLQLLCIYETVR
jgi:hypothetical protein